MAFAVALAIVPSLAWADDVPLSAAQQALFDTPHLANVAQPETLAYQFEEIGPAGFTDRVAMTVADINADGSKDLRFDFLTGARHVVYPGIGHFTANPLLMLFLDYDVRQMREQTGMAAAYFRERLRQACLDGATLREDAAMLDGRHVATRVIVLHPYADDPHFGRVHAIAGKTYTFVLSADVPGGVLAIRADAPDDPALHAPALGHTLLFKGVEP